MSEDTIITHAEALRLIDEHVGDKKVYLALLVKRGDADHPDPTVPFFHRIGPLENPLEPKPPRLEPDHGAYKMGGLMGEMFYFAPMTGTVHSRDNGVDFRVADGVTIRIAWRGSTEVGDWRPTAESLARLNAAGMTLPEHEGPDVVLPSEKADAPDA
jgi:hypothetical protein